MEDWTDRWQAWSGGRLHFLAAGHGTGDRPPLVFLHGGAADSAWRSWEEAPRFLPGRRLLAPDFPGFGESELVSEQVDVPLLLQSVTAFADELELDRFDLVGFSTGGLIATHLALQQPGRIRRLVLVAAAGLAPGIPFRPLADLVASFPWIHRILYWGAGLNFQLMKFGMRRLVHDPRRLSPEFLLQTRRMLRKPGAGAAWRKFLRAELAGNHFRNQVATSLPTLRVPTLLLHGRHDQLVPVDHSIQAARQIEGSCLHIFEDCGHWIHREDPAGFYAEIDGFGDRTAEPAGG